MCGKHIPSSVRHGAQQTLSLYNFCISIVPQSATMICTESLGAKVGSEEGNSPDRMPGFLGHRLVGKEVIE